MPRVLGYADPLSVAPGEAIRFMVGTLDGPRRYRAEVVRLISGDTGPEGPGLKAERLATPIEGEHEGTPQPIDAGSYAIVERPEAFGALERFTLQAFIQPTRVPVRPEPRRQVIMGTWAEDRGAGFALMLDEAGALAFLVGAALVSTGVPLTARRWYHVAAAVDLAAGTVTLRQTPLAEHAPSLEQPVAVTSSSVPPTGPSRPAGDRRRGTSTARSTARPSRDGRSPRRSSRPRRRRRAPPSPRRTRSASGTSPPTSPPTA